MISLFSVCHHDAITSLLFLHFQLHFVFFFHYFVNLLQYFSCIFVLNLIAEKLLVILLIFSIEDELFGVAVAHTSLDIDCAVVYIWLAQERPIRARTP